MKLHKFHLCLLTKHAVVFRASTVMGGGQCESVWVESVTLLVSFNAGV